MDFDYWKSQGVFFATGEQGVVDFLATHYPGFRLEQLLQGLLDVAAKWKFEWGKSQFSITTSGNLHVHYQYDDLTSSKEEDSLIVKRVLKKASENGLRVSHEEMFLPVGLQDQGLSRDLIRPFYEQYKAARVDFIEAVAAATRGGYALARYAFAAANRRDVLGVLEHGLKCGIPEDDIQELREDFEQFCSENSEATPFSMWEWGQTDFAEKLLTGTRWHAILDLNNQFQKRLFEAYLYSTNRANPPSIP